MYLELKESAASFTRTPQLMYTASHCVCSTIYNKIIINNNQIRSAVFRIEEEEEKNSTVLLLFFFLSFYLVIRVSQCVSHFKLIYYNNEERRFFVHSLSLSLSHSFVDHQASTPYTGLSNH